MDAHARAGRLPVGTLVALEARAHRWPRRAVRDVLGGLLVHDPEDHEPVFNRLVDPDLPEADSQFDDWLRRVRVVFDRIARRPHLWLTAPSEDARIARLERAGFGQVGASRYMYLDDRSAIGLAVPSGATPAGATIERIDATTHDPLRAARDVAAVIADAFELDPAFHVLVEHDVVEMLDVAAISFVLARVEGEAVAVARRTTEGRASLLAAIGTRRGYRTRGFGRLVTSTATRDALAAGSDTVFLGVEDGNDAARHLYERLGYTFADGGVTALLQR
jgi:ribosomal protein S18 acetylase RimI-like enzyme